MKKKNPFIFFIFIFILVIVSIISFIIFGVQYSIVQETRYFYNCEGSFIYELDYSHGNNNFYVDCNDYYVGKTCRGRGIESSTKLTKEETASKLCKTLSENINNSAVFQNGRVSSCTSSYDHCYRMDTNNEDMGTYAEFSWSWVFDKTLKLKYSCESTDSTTKAGLVYRVSQFDTRMKCRKIPGQEDYECGGFHTNPLNQGNIYNFNDVGEIEISYLDLLEWNKTGYDLIYVHVGCFGKYYADFLSDYVFIQDYMSFPIGLMAQCKNTDECNDGIRKEVYIDPVYKDVKWCLVRCLRDGTSGWYGNDCQGWNVGCGGNKCIVQPDGSCRDSGYTEIRQELVTEGYYTTEYHKIFDDNVYRECINNKCQKPSICGDGICDISEDCLEDCQILCNSDVFECSDGTILQRDINNDCKFPKCPTCITQDWQPSPSEYCSYEEFTQKSNCGEERTITGTKNCQNKYLVGGIVSSFLLIIAFGFRKFYK